MEEEDYSLNYELYEKELRLKDMYFGVTKPIKLTDIYSEVNKLKDKDDMRFIFWKDDKYIRVQKRADEYSFYLDIVTNKNKNEDFLYSQELYFKPIRLYLAGKDYMDIVSPEQFRNIGEKYKNENIHLYCTKEKKPEEFEICNLLDHLECNCKIIVISKKDEKLIKEVEFKKLFKAFPRNDKFKTPYDFEMHYSEYFEFDKYYETDTEFHYFNDERRKRKNFTDLLKSLYLNNIYIIFGKGGIGKSITIIKVFKYGYNHKKYGTLYINCKYIYKEFKNNIDLMKKILKDEIIYLFEDEYNSYIECVNMIEQYKPDKISTFWELIRKIIEFCKNKKKRYYIVFDQYKNKIDKDGELFKLNEELKTKNKFCLVACCSLNDKDIRYYKIKELFDLSPDSKNIKNAPDNLRIREIDHLLDEITLSIDNGGQFDKAFKKLGKNIKNYIALSEIKSFFPDKLGEFIKSKKKIIQDKLLDFYKIESIKESNLTFINNLFKFSAETEYEINYLAQIQDYIPFKYFDVIKNEKNKNYAKIVYNFELIKEVLNDIYELLIFENNSIYKIFSSNELLDEGSLGGLFEKYVIYNMMPKKDKKSNKLFGSFEIKYIYDVKKFVPKNNENWKDRSYIKVHLNPGTYLFKQKNFNGKGFDAAIIIINDKNEATVYLFQISINKQEIYTIIYLGNLIDIFIEYFALLFTFSLNKERIYFTYIFDAKHKDELLRKCDSNKMKCIFFKSSIKIFTDKNEINLEKKDNIEENFVSLRNNLYGKDIEMKNSSDLQMQRVYLNESQLNNLIIFLRNKFGENEKINLIFSNNTDIIEDIFSIEEVILLRNIKRDELDIWIDCIEGGIKEFEKIIKQNKKNQEVEFAEEKDAFEGNNKNIIKNNFKLLIIKNKPLDFFLIFPGGEIIGIEKVTLKNEREKYDVFYIEKL